MLCRSIAAVGVCLLLPDIARADSEILNQTAALFQSATAGWFASIFPAARNLFLLLMTIEIAWSGIEYVLAGDFPIGAFFRRLAAVLFFFVILNNAQVWIPSVIESFVALGSNAVNSPVPVTPTGIIDMGISLADALRKSAQETSGVFGLSLDSVLIAVAATLVLLGFGLIALQFLLALVESYVVIGAGIILIGFAGSRWTVGFAERFLGYAVSVGVKLLVLTLIVGTGTSLAVSWFPTLQAADADFGDAMAVALSSVVFLGVTFSAPSLATAILNGASSLGLGTAFAGALSVASAATPATRAAYATVRTAATVGGSATAALYRAAVNAGRTAVRNPADPYRR
jgi:type IV secretion system protein TrbL